MSIEATIKFALECLLKIVRALKLLVNRTDNVFAKKEIDMSFLYFKTNIEEE